MTAKPKILWAEAPKKTTWGDGIAWGLIELDKDHTISVYVEDDIKHKVERRFQKLFAKPAPKLKAIGRKLIWRDSVRPQPLWPDGSDCIRSYAEFPVSETWPNKPDSPWEEGEPVYVVEKP